MIEAFFPVDPGDLAVNRAYKCTCTAGRGKVYAAAKHKAAKQVVIATAAKEWDDAPVYPDGPVWVEYTIRPARRHREGAAKGQGLLDVDAPSKALLDALNGAAYTDDSQVQRVIGSKTLEGPVGIRVKVYREDEAPKAGRPSEYPERLLEMARGAGGVLEFRSVEDVAIELECVRRSAYNALRKLVRDGLVRVTRSKSGSVVSVRLEVV